MCVVAAVWGVYEAVSSAYDVYSAARTVADPRATTREKVGAVALAAIGVVGPGGGYTAVGRNADGFVNLASSGRTRHILHGDASGGGHLFPGKPGKTPFPADWSAERVMHEISDVATDPRSAVSKGRGGRAIVRGSRDGVDISVVLESPSRGGGIVTGFPTNLPRNP